VSINIKDNGHFVPDGHALIVNSADDLTSGQIPLVSQNSGDPNNAEPESTANLSNGTLTIDRQGAWTYEVIGVVHAPTIGTQLAVLKGSDTAGSGDFGVSVAISGTTAVVGGGGRVYVFTKTGDNWPQVPVTELEGSDTVAGDAFGHSVAISGTTAVIGDPYYDNRAGRAYVFTKTGKNWPQVAELVGSDTVAGDYFGASVAISGTTVVVGAVGAARNAGSAYVFTKTGKNWPQVAELKGSDTVAGDLFGDSVAISGTTAVVGAQGYADNAGRAYVFTKKGKNWPQVAELKGSDTVAGDQLGYSLAMSGTTAVVGAAWHANGAGRVYVFTEKAGHWPQAAELEDSNTLAGGFGYSVAISGATVVVGMLSTKSSSTSWVDVFTKTGDNWPQVPVAELEVSGTTANVTVQVS
jgi:hypothetical protein